jgi:hypothetical protein
MCKKVRLGRCLLTFHLNLFTTVVQVTTKTYTYQSEKNVPRILYFPAENIVMNKRNEKQTEKTNIF